MPQKLTYDEVARIPVLGGDPQIDPAGERIAYVVIQPVRENTKLFKQNIWMVNADGTGERQFTHGPRADYHPRWSPDGTQLAFLSDRLEDGKPQVCCMPRDGGEAFVLTELKGALDASVGRSALQWSPDGKHLYFLMFDPETEAQKQRREKKDDAVEHEKLRCYARLWSLEISTRKLTQITRGNVQVWDYQVSPDGRRFALVISDEPFESAWYHSRLAVIPASGGAPKTIYTPAQRQIVYPRWSPDQKQIAFLSSVWSDRTIHHGGVSIVPAQGGEARSLTDDYRGSFGCIEWLRNGRALLAVGHEEAQATVASIDPRKGGVTTLWRKPVVISEIAWPRFTLDRAQRRAAIVLEGPRSPRAVWRLDVRGMGVSPMRLKNLVGLKQLTRPSFNLQKFPLGHQQIIRWKSCDGWEIQGVLIKPVGYKAGRRYPLLVCIHGGPTSVVGNGFLVSSFSNNFIWNQVLATRGYALFYPNFRGSAGYGLKFAEANVGDMGGQDFHDIDSGVDALIERGLADPQRLAIAGWSYGGFMACWTVTQTTRYKAAIMGAGISNWHSFHGNTEIHTWDAAQYRADPYQRDGAYARFSGMNFVDRVRTPTLILHGQTDLCVPPEQAYQFHRALLDHKVHSELVLYPREGHNISEKAHWLEMRHRVTAWFDRYLKEK